MQHPNLQGRELTGDEIDSGNHSGADATPRVESDDSVLRQLVTASKEAEGVIACLFELHFISAVPLEHIWDKLARAIKAAQQRLQLHDRSSGLHSIDRSQQGRL